MAKITNKIVTVPLLGNFKEETDKIYVAKVNGKELSTNDFSNDYKGQLDNLNDTLDNYVEKEDDKGLSKNDFDDTYKGKLDNLDTTLNGYVTKEQGKGLSTNDYDAAAKAIVDGVATTYATKAEVQEHIATAVVYKGSVATYADLASKEATAKNGDMYNVAETDMNYVWNGSTWDPQAPTFSTDNLVKYDDLTEATKEDITGLFQS